jgi:hypothetical protein
VGGLGEPAGPQHGVEHLDADCHPVRLDLLDHDDLGEAAGSQRPDEDVVGGDAEPCGRSPSKRSQADCAEPGSMATPGLIAPRGPTWAPAGER